MVEIVKGDPIRIWSPHNTESHVTSCRFKAGRVVRGNPAECPMPEYLVQKSLAPGCVERIRQAVAIGGIEIASPAGCEYD